MIEFSICIMFFVLISFVLWEIGNALVAYQKLSSIASEGVLLAGRSDLAEVECVAEVKFLPDSSYDVTGDNCGLSSVNGQLLDLISRSQQVLSVFSENLRVSTTLVVQNEDPVTLDAYSAYEVEMNDKVIVGISGTYRGVMIALNFLGLSLDVSVRKEGPYLNSSSL